MAQAWAVNNLRRFSPFSRSARLGAVMRHGSGARLSDRRQREAAATSGDAPSAPVAPGGGVQQHRERRKVRREREEMGMAW